MKDKGRAKESWLDRFFLRGFPPYLWIVGLGFLLYFKSLFFGLTFLDDNVTVLDNFNVLKDISNLFRTFTELTIPAFNSFYRPISNIPYILDAQFGAPYPAIYHLTSLVLHLSAACLLFLLLTKLEYERLPALIMSLLFVVHPALAMNVAWVPGSIDVLLSLFVLPSFIFFLDYLKTNKRGYYLLHLLFFVLALLTKETALVMVLLCPLYAFLVARGGGRLVKTMKAALGWLAVAAVWFLVRQSVLVAPTAVTSAVLIRSVFNPTAVLLYIGKIVLPFNLAPLPTLQDSSLYFGLAALALILALLFFTKVKRYGFIIFGSLWFLLFLLPGLVFSDFSLFTGVAFYEHRLYLPLMGFLILFLETDLVRSLSFKKKISLTVSLAVLVLFAILTFMHIDIFKDRIAFWESAAQSSPHHPMVHRNLGAMYYLDGRLDKAEPEYQKALELNPAEPMAHNNLGLIYMGRGELKEAEVEFAKELEINPNYDNALFNLGLLYAREGKLKKARILWEKTLQVNPGYNDARNNLRLIDGK